MTEEEKEEIISMMKNKKKVTKNLTIILVCAIFIIGVTASFKNSIIDIDKYVKFLTEYKVILSVLLTSVGAGFVADRFKKDR